ncbi:hypothetical protein ILUMI_15652 [Ignelater luminosus]|uniref:C2H2-type domain-containing protein n=1 Tax=Ignelater luminosus TaxID=2038154 RepID=A0A8K0G9B3_IGNLU|nr:hypothetical protein ILUMI_15652 [Ignelater luminosus]
MQLIRRPTIIKNEHWYRKKLSIDVDVVLGGFETRPWRTAKEQIHDKPFKCLKCSKSYKYHPNLCRHVKYECDGIAHFPCPVCSKAYTQRTYVRHHLRSKHPDYKLNSELYKRCNFYRAEEKFTCGRCGKKYKYKRGFVRHYKYECVTDKQFQCEICLKTFRQRWYLKTHMKIVHSV